MSDGRSYDESIQYRPRHVQDAAFAASGKRKKKITRPRIIAVDNFVLFSPSAANKYGVSINKKTLQIIKWGFATLEEAQAYRDQCLATIQPKEPKQ